MVQIGLNIHPKFSLICEILENGYGTSLIYTDNTQFYYEAIAKGWLDHVRIRIGIRLNQEGQSMLFSALLTNYDSAEIMRYPGVNITGLNYDNVLHIKHGINCTIEELRKNCNLFFFPKIIDFGSNFQDYVCITDSYQAMVDTVKVIYEFAKFYSNYDLAKNGEDEVYLLGSSIMLLYLEYTNNEQYLEFEQNLIGYIDTMIMADSRKYRNLKEENRINILHKKIYNFKYDVKRYLQDPNYKLKNIFYSLFVKPLNWNTNDINYTYVEEELLELKVIFVQSYRYLNRIMNKEFDLELNRLYEKSWSILHK